MLITLYSENMFPDNLRADFELPSWPYSEDPEDREDFENYMKSLSVFRYDDSDTEIDGRNVSYPISIKLWEKPKQAPFYAYINSVYVDDSFKPIIWPGGESESESRLEKLRNHKIASDMLAWSHWNVKCEVEALTDSMIKRKILSEFLDQDLCHYGDCWKNDPLGRVS